MYVYVYEYCVCIWVCTYMYTRTQIADLFSSWFYTSYGSYYSETPVVWPHQFLGERRIYFLGYYHEIDDSILQLVKCLCLVLRHTVQYCLPEQGARTNLCCFLSKYFLPPAFTQWWFFYLLLLCSWICLCCASLFWVPGSSLLAWHLELLPDLSFAKLIQPQT